MYSCKRCTLQRKSHRKRPHRTSNTNVARSTHRMKTNGNRWKILWLRWASIREKYAPCARDEISQDKSRSLTRSLYSKNNTPYDLDEMSPGKPHRCIICTHSTTWKLHKVHRTKFHRINLVVNAQVEISQVKSITCSTCTRNCTEFTRDRIFTGFHNNRFCRPSLSGPV